MPQSTAITNSLLRLALALMCVLNFESCALVRQRTKRESLHQRQYEHHESITKKELCDSLFRSLQISFDSVEIICYDSTSSVPSPMVKVRATKATISSETNHTVTGRELDASTDTLSVESSVEKVEERIAEPRRKPPWWVWLAGIAAVAVCLLAGFRMRK